MAAGACDIAAASSVATILGLAFIAIEVVFREPIAAIEFSGAVLVMAGLALNVFGDRLNLRRALASG